MGRDPGVDWMGNRSGVYIFFLGKKWGDFSGEMLMNRVSIGGVYVGRGRKRVRVYMGEFWTVYVGRWRKGVRVYMGEFWNISSFAWRKEGISSLFYEKT